MRIGGVLSWIVLLVACGGGASTSGVRTTSAGEGPPEGGNTNGGTALVDGSGGDVAPDGVVAPESHGAEILVSGHGFAPQPAIRQGMAGGTRDGSSFSPDCVGHFPATPQHVIKLGAPIDLLRVVVDSPEDLTLAIRTPDGVFHCNDDSGDPGNGLNPTVEIYGAPSGNLDVYVGVYSEGSTGTEYRLGVTEQPGPPSSLLRF